jgi:type III secretion protein V
VISAFSGFVVQGNLVVGVVVFLIITVVQFVVIAKGAERVAEVSARFSLDALPGKQMAIDADLRSGIIGPADAGARRFDLQTESRLYGSLDGAMRFVKGDAVAGLLITSVNIIAGTIVGMTFHNLGALEAAGQFAFYSIGDGLVSQIPALLIAVAAGIAVTRVSSQNHSFVGREMIAQLTSEPQAVMLTGTVLALIGIVPGMPKIAFFLSSAILIVLAFKLKKLNEKGPTALENVVFSPQVFSGLSFQFSREGINTLRQENKLDALVQKIRQQVFQETGVLVPNPQILSDTISSGLVAEIEIAGCRPCGLASLSESETCLSSEVANKFEVYLRSNLSKLIDDNATRMLFDVHSTVSESMVNSLVPEQVSVTTVTRLLRELVDEEVSIRNLQCILQAMSEYCYLSNGKVAEGASMPSLVEWVRQSLKAEICKDLDPSLATAYFSEGLEQSFERIGSSSGPEYKRLQGRFLEELKRLEESSVKTVLCSTKLRTWLALTFSMVCPNLRFVSFDELLPELEFNNLQEVQIAV